MYYSQVFNKDEKMKHSVKTYEKLIQLVKNNPPIYVSTMAEYRDTHLVRKIWQTIAAQMNTANMTCKYQLIVHLNWYGA